HDAVTRLARRLGLPDERRQRYANRRALDAGGRRPDDGAHDDRVRQVVYGAARAHTRLAARRRGPGPDRERAVRRAAVLQRARAARRARPRAEETVAQSYSVYLRASPRTRLSSRHAHRRPAAAVVRDRPRESFGLRAPEQPEPRGCARPRAQAGAPR